MYVLIIARIGICLFPENDWLGKRDKLFGILINIPLAITLSFAFYIPVVLWADQIPMLGMLIISKTLAYVWVIIMCVKLKEKCEEELNS